jgi:hypothetical protein
MKKMFLFKFGKIFKPVQKPVQTGFEKNIRNLKTTLFV